MAERGKGKLPSTTEVNPKEGAMAITLRSGTKLEPEKKREGIPTTKKEERQQKEQYK